MSQGERTRGDAYTVATRGRGLGLTVKKPSPDPFFSFWRGGLNLARLFFVRQPNSERSCGGPTRPTPTSVVFLADAARDKIALERTLRVRTLGAPRRTRLVAY